MAQAPGASHPGAMGPRRRLAAGLVAVATALTGASCADGSSDPAPVPAEGWARLADPPLAPRLEAVTAWTGTEALFLGGGLRGDEDLAALCGDGGGCEYPFVPARDGAAYDPARETWRRTADAPVPLPRSAYSTTVGDVVYLLDAARLLSYDASDDAWTVHPRLRGAGHYTHRLAAVGERVLATLEVRRPGDPPDRLYDPATRRWSAVAADPLGPAWDRRVVATPAGVVLTGTRPLGEPLGPQPVRATVLDLATSRWRTLPDSRQLPGLGPTWTGRRLVDLPHDPAVSLAELPAEGGALRFGGTLDPATGTWGRLPPSPSGILPWRVDALGARYSVAGGVVFDDREERWTPLGRPDCAAEEIGGAVWAGELLVVLGGFDRDEPGDGATSAGAWAYEPATSGSP